MVEFGKRLRQLRKSNKFTQKQLAALIGVQNTMISFYEVGERIPSPEMIIKLASVFHVTTDYLLGIEKSESINIAGLNEQDKQLVYALVERLRQKNT